MYNVNHCIYSNNHHTPYFKQKDLQNLNFWTKIKMCLLGYLLIATELKILINEGRSNPRLESYSKE